MGQADTDDRWMLMGDYAYQVVVERKDDGSTTYIGRVRPLDPMYESPPAATPEEAERMVKAYIARRMRGSGPDAEPHGAP